ncbi:MAG: hypothetical protein H6R26_3390, partial [Proteobacteria bacterium]|nr:hypothetical protein [Pseudomonadota bacterium]
MSNIHAFLKIPVPDLIWPELSIADIQTCAALLMFSLLFALEARSGYRRPLPRVARNSYFTNLGIL